LHRVERLTLTAAATDAARTTVTVAQPDNNNNNNNNISFIHAILLHNRLTVADYMDSKSYFLPHSISLKLSPVSREYFTKGKQSIVVVVVVVFVVVVVLMRLFLWRKMILS